MAAGDLTVKQRAFVDAYFARGFNATQAAKDAGYSEESARSIGSENLTKPDIRAAIEERFAQLATDAEAVRKLLVRELVAIVSSDLTGLVEWDETGMRLVPSSELSHEQAASLREVTQLIEGVPGEDGESVPLRIRRSGLKQHDKVRAAHLLARLHGLDRTNVHVSGSVGITLTRLHELADAGDGDAGDD